MATKNIQEAARGGGHVVIAVPAETAEVQAAATTGGVQRRSRPAAAAPAARPSAPSDFALLEEAQRRCTTVSHRQRVTQCAFRVLRKVLFATGAFLVVGFATRALTEYQTLGDDLMIAGVILELASWALLLCTCTERTRAFLASLLRLRPRGRKLEI
ncbi:uncharacterized protein [Dermacentor albipictus]|uniref:uncharacterized protein n=1 Tax=Dermacentor albipictus TaxID=60249 RepID=UPI0031FD5E7F